MTNAEKLRKIREILTARRETLQSSGDVFNTYPDAYYNTPEGNLFVELEGLILAILDEERF